MIQGKKVILRLVERTDLETLVVWRNNPAISKYFFNVLPLSLSGQDRWFEDLLRRDDKKLFIIETKEHLSVGTIGLDRIDRRNQSAELGNMLIEPGHLGKGLAGDAALALLRFAFTGLNLNRIYLKVFSWNESAIKLYLKCGFQKEGLLRQAVYKGGGFQDLVLMAILRDEFVTKEPSR